LGHLFRVHIHGQYDEVFTQCLAQRLNASIDLSHGSSEPAEGNFRVLVAGRPSRELLEQSDCLEALVIPWAGVSESTASMLKDYPHIGVYNIHHNAGAAAEMAITLMLTAAKRVIPAHNGLMQGDWSIRYGLDNSMLICGSDVLVLGWGSIGQRTGLICRSMGATVRGIRRTADTSDETAGVFPPERLHDLLPGTDILIVCIPLTQATRGIIGDDELSLLPSHAVLVNVARGAVVCEESLFRHLKTGSIGAAGLDVWYTYPESEDARKATPPSDFPFRELENVVMSPHRGGAFGVRKLEQLRIEYLADAINALAGGNEPLGRVNLAQGY
jgi:phosphoglycerate dehydrogenase-like enzyme